MLVRLTGSLRYRHWLAAEAILFALSVSIILYVIAPAVGHRISWLGAVCVVVALTVLASSIPILTALPDGPRFRVRDVEMGVTTRSLFPRRRPLGARQGEQSWLPAVWSPDDVTHWSPERDRE